MSTAHKAGRLTMWAIVVGLLTVAIDQATKQWALSSLGDGARRRLFGDLLGFELHFNPGAAFSFLTGSTWVFTVVAAVVVLALPLWIRRTSSLPWTITLGVVWGGAAGNLVDRLFRQPGVGRGHVVDFIAYGRWFIGNVADVALVLGIVVIVVLTWLSVPFDGESGRGNEQVGEADGGEGREGQSDGAAEARRTDGGAARDAGVDDRVAVAAGGGGGAAARLSPGGVDEGAISDVEKPVEPGKNTELSARPGELGHA